MRWTVCTLAALSLAAPALAGPPGRGGFGGPGGRPGGFGDPEAMEERMDQRAERMAELLDLTADQKAAFDKLRGDEFERAKPKLERMRAAHEELRGLLDADTTDAARVGALVIETHQLKGELKAAKDAVEAELVKLLDDEQRFAFEALQESRKGGHDRRGKGHRGPGGRGGWDAPPPPQG